MFRSIWVPSLIACVIGLPLLLRDSSKLEPTANPNYPNLTVYQSSSSGFGERGAATLPSSTRPTGAGRAYQAINQIQYQTAPTGNPAVRSPYAATANPAVSIAGNQPLPVAHIYPGPSPHSAFSSQSALGNPALPYPTVGTRLPLPDYGAAENFVFSGDADGPNLNHPLSFVPVTNLQEVFRFNADQQWVKRRWKRISSVPAEDGLKGLRVALVTGTNSWDLHGSQTYYFDNHHKLQRITFRGWTGDGERLIKMLTEVFKFQSRPTSLAGFYTAVKGNRTTGAAMTKHPSVIYSENPVQQLGVILEINNQDGPFTLSRDFQSLIQGSH